jgi:hypothetical protein
MKSKLVTGIAAGMLTLAAVTFAGHDMVGMIAGAKTAAQHEAVAADYAKQATKASQMAAKHEAMAKKYTGAAREKLHLDDHCRTIANNYRSTAKELKAMAEGHRTLAKEAGQKEAGQ